MSPGIPSDRMSLTRKDFIVMLEKEYPFLKVKELVFLKEIEANRQYYVEVVCEKWLVPIKNKKDMMTFNIQLRRRNPIITLATSSPIAEGKILYDKRDTVQVITTLPVKQQKALERVKRQLAL